MEKCHTFKNFTVLQFKVIENQSLWNVKSPVYLCTDKKVPTVYSDI